MELIVSETTNTAELIGRVFSDEYDDRFTILSADHAPALNALAYGARSEGAGGYYFAALVPYGKTLKG